MTETDFQKVIENLCDEGRRLCGETLTELQLRGKFHERSALLKALVVTIHASDQAGEPELSAYLHGMLFALPKRWMRQEEGKTHEPN